MPASARADRHQRRRRAGRPREGGASVGRRRLSRCNHGAPCGKGGGGRSRRPQPDRCGRRGPCRKRQSLCAGAAGAAVFRRRHRVGRRDQHRWRDLAAQALGADLCYMGTRFIATEESLAPRAYKDMLVATQTHEVVYTSVFTGGVPCNFMKTSIRANGFDPEALSAESVSALEAFETTQALAGHLGCRSGRRTHQRHPERP